MGLTREQALRLFKSKLTAIAAENNQKKQDQLDDEREAQIKTQERNAQLTMLLKSIDIGQTIGERAQAKLLSQTYEGVEGTRPPKFQFKPPAKITEPGKMIKRFVDPKSALEPTPEYTEYGAPPKVPIDMEDDFFVPGQDVAPLSWKADETIPYSYGGGNILDITAERYAAETAEAARGLEISQTVDPITGEVNVPVPERDVTRGIPKVDDVVTVPMAIGGDPTVSGAPIPEAPIPEAPEVEVPDAQPELISKALEAGQTAFHLKNIGDTLTDKDATHEEQSIAGLQGVKLLADLATKRAGQQSVTELGSRALSNALTKRGIKEGVKLTGRQAVGAAAGGVLGGYTAVTEAKEAGEAWEEKDYDEAILHGMGSASGGLQTAGAGMMVTGIGAPLGAVLYGIGTAGALASSAGLFLEGLFGGKKEKEEAPKPRFDVSRYLDVLGRRRKHF